MFCFASPKSRQFRDFKKAPQLTLMLTFPPFGLHEMLELKVSLVPKRCQPFPLWHGAIAMTSYNVSNADSNTFMYSSSCVHHHSCIHHAFIHHHVFMYS